MRLETRLRTTWVVMASTMVDCLPQKARPRKSTQCRASVSEINSALGDRQCRLLHGFAQCRMRVAGAGDVFGRRTEFHGDGGLCDHGLGIGSENMDAKHAVRLGIGEDFNEALGREIC